MRPWLADIRLSSNGTEGAQAAAQALEETNLRSYAFLDRVAECNDDIAAMRSAIS